jgi:hypothetical protein
LQGEGKSVKVIFLDIDGVLVTPEEIALPRVNEHSRHNKRCVELLNRITNETGARIVVSSSWKSFTNIKEILNDDFGVTGLVMGVTDGYAGSRGMQIRAWMERHTVRSFIFIDDSLDTDGLEHRLVRTNWKTGLTEADAEKAIQLLNEV